MNLAHCRATPFILFLVPLLDLSATKNIYAQEPLRISDQVVCTTCEIVLEEKALLGGLLDGFDLRSTDARRIFRDFPDGYWLTPGRNPGLIIHFDEHGAQDFTIDRRGDGPAEFKSIQAVYTRAQDTIHVIGLGRMGFLSREGKPHSGTSAYRTGPILNPLFLSDGSVVVNAWIPFSPEQGNHVFAHISKSGELIRPFGPTVERNPEAPLGQMWETTPASGDLFWAVQAQEYTLHLMDVDGEISQQIVREADWFKPWAGGTSSPFSERPQPVIASIEQDEQGLIWVVMLVADAEWKPVDSPPALDSAKGRTDKVRDTIIEVLDPIRGEVIARQRFDEMLTNLMPGPRIVGYDTGMLGTPQLRIFSLELVDLASSTNGR